MRRKLVLVGEQKLFRLLPGKTGRSRLEASGVARVDDQTALVIFDNFNRLARFDLSLSFPADCRRLAGLGAAVGRAHR